MSNTYKIDFRSLRQENLKGIFESFEKALNNVGIDFYLIGAVARDTWFAQKGKRALGTKDIDFAVLISDPEKYLQLKQFLVSGEGFIESSVNEYVLFDNKGFAIDLIPFGALEIEGKKIIDSEGLARTDLSGFNEVYEAATEKVNFGGRFNFNVATLAGIVILKFIAYDDRPEMRSQDIKDIGAIIKEFFNLQREVIYNHHLDLFENESDSIKISARVLGRQMGLVLTRNDLLGQRLNTILHQYKESLSTARPIYLWDDGESPIDVEYQVQVIHEMLKGIEDQM